MIMEIWPAEGPGLHDHGVRDRAGGTPRLARCRLRLDLAGSLGQIRPV